MLSPANEIRVLPTVDGDKTAMPQPDSTAGGFTATADGEAMLAMPVGTRLHEFEITGIIGGAASASFMPHRICRSTARWRSRSTCRVRWRRAPAAAEEEAAAQKTA